MRRWGIVVGMLALVAGQRVGHAYRADLISTVPDREEGRVEGVVTISDVDGKVHAVISGVTDPAGAPLDAVVVQLRLQVNDRRRRIRLPFPLAGGAGNASWSLRLTEGDRVVVNDLRVRTTHGRTLARAGVMATALGGDPDSPLPDCPSTPPSQPLGCGEAFELCQIDLAYCEEELDICDAQLP
jgi:hypothetical protein